MARDPPRSRAPLGGETGAVMLHLVPITQTDAYAYIRRYHRHLSANAMRRADRALFAVAVADDADTIRGVAVVGRPKARMLQDAWTAEVTRVATDGARNACSMLYGACWRAARALGWRRLVTYNRPGAGETGASLRGAGFRVVGETTAQSWDRPSRPRVDREPLQGKLRWEVVA